MNKSTIGDLINYERRKKNITVRKLTDGICSVSTLQRLESGERLPDFFVVERIVERLGRSVNKIEFLQDEDSYKICYLREMIEEHLEQKRYEDVLEALEYYKSLPEAEKILHKQYILKIEAVVKAEKEQKHKQAKEIMIRALNLTVPNFSWEKLDDFVLGEEELLLILMWISESEACETTPFEMDGRRIFNYIERMCQDEEVKANIYSKAAWVFGSIFLKHHKYEDAYFCTFQGIKVLTNNGLLMHLPQFLERILGLAKVQSPQTYYEWERCLRALKRTYEEYHEVWKSDEIYLWKKYRQIEVFLLSELFGQERRIIGESQEKVADSLYIDAKTVCRLEKGRYKPKAGIFQKMKEYLQIERDICNTRIVTDNFSLLELEREIARLNHHRREREAETIYEKLKRQLSDRWKENRQYICYMDMLFANQLGRIGPKEALEECIRAFHITRKNFDFRDLDKIVLSRMEVYIINYMAICYDKLNDKNKSIELLEGAMSGYVRSKVNLKYHYVPVALIYQHLAFDCEECDRLEEAIKWCDKAIRFDLVCRKGLNLGIMLEEKIYAQGKMKGNVLLGKEEYRQAYYILKLMKKEKQMQILKEVFIEWYGEEING